MASFSSAIILSVFLFLLKMVSAQLSSNFYETSCPMALSVIEGAVSSAVAVERRMGASLLRLHFHDCFANGCDASILLDDTATFTGEKTALPNVNSVRGYEVIDNIKSQLEYMCPGVVSCADILTIAARDSVVALGGFTWTVGLGRRDSTTASLDDAYNLPSPFFDLSDLLSTFQEKGFTAQELVALSGAHTIGEARCLFYRNRISNESNIDPTFAASMQSNCPSAGGENNLYPLDETSTVFDNTYFRNLKEMKGFLHSDQVLFNQASSDSQVNTYSLDSATFFTDFGNAMIKIGNLNPLTGTEGEIRTNCRKINGYY